MKRSLAPGAAPGGTSTVCAAPLGMRHLDAVGVITRERALRMAGAERRWLRQEGGTRPVALAE